MAEQLGGSQAGALELRAPVLEEDSGAARRGASQSGADHALLERTQLRGAAAGRWVNRGWGCCYDPRVLYRLYTQLDDLSSRQWPQYGVKER